MDVFHCFNLEPASTLFASPFFRFAVEQPLLVNESREHFVASLNFGRNQ